MVRGFQPLTLLHPGDDNPGMAPRCPRSRDSCPKFTFFNKMVWRFQKAGTKQVAHVFIVRVVGHT